MFAFDIVIDNLENCNNASFRLKFNNTNHVKFSGASINDFGEENGVLFLYEESIPNSNEVILDIGIFSGQPLQENEFDNPNLMNLEFVVMPTAPDNESVNFTFENAFGASFVDSVGQSIPLLVQPVEFDIHGFVNVWPGDTDTDGDVDNIDYLNVWENLKFTDRFPGYRSFKRKNPSSLYKAQRVLVWDVEEATYADCDGDGDISVNDGAVVLLNITEDGSSAPPSQIAHLNGFTDKQKNNNELNTTNFKIPIYANAQEDIYGAVGLIDIDNIEGFIGIENGDLLYDAQIISEKRGNRIEFVMGDFDKNQLDKHSGVLAYLIFEDNSDIQNLTVTSLKGITNNKRFIDLNTTSSVKPTNTSEIVNTQNDFIINSEKSIESITVYNLSGQLLKSLNPRSQKHIISKSSLPKGLILITIDGETIPVINR
jgi:hypothetical protein